MFLSLLKSTTVLVFTFGVLHWLKLASPALWPPVGYDEPEDTCLVLDLPGAGVVTVSISCLSSGFQLSPVGRVFRISTLGTLLSMPNVSRYNLCISGPCNMAFYHGHIDHSVHVSVYHGRYFAHVQTCDTWNIARGSKYMAQQVYPSIQLWPDQSIDQVGPNLTSSLHEFWAEVVYCE